MKLVIGLSRSKKSFRPYSEIIIWWDKLKNKSDLKISHAYGRFYSDSWKRSFIYQAAGIRTHFLSEKLFLTDNIMVEEFELDLPVEVVNQIGKVCVDREGTPYAFKQTLGIVVVGLAWLISMGKANIKNPYADGAAKVNCLEEWVNIICNEMKLKKPENRESMTPYEFRKWLITLPFTKKIKGESNGNR